MVCGRGMAKQNHVAVPILENVTGFAIAEAACEHMLRHLECKMNHKYVLILLTWNKVLLEMHCLCAN